MMGSKARSFDPIDGLTLPTLCSPITATAT